MNSTLGPNARLALATIYQQPDPRVPSHFFNVMEHSHIDRLAGLPAGGYKRDPHGAYIRMVEATGSCSVDQYLAENPLSMEDHGYEGAVHGATTGAGDPVLDGMTIDTPEAVVHHLESVAIPALQGALANTRPDDIASGISHHETDLQARLGGNVLKIPYGHGAFPTMSYGLYGYPRYFEAWALYPEVIERHFSAQADLAAIHNAGVAMAFHQSQLPPMLRLDHDMAGTRGPLASMASLERLWFPHFARSIAPLLQAGIRLIWHCDGNLMPMVPRLVDCGVSGFQGFQYEHGMDYVRICRMRDREGRGMIIVAGASVTTTLPRGTPQQVRDEIRWLVDNGPATGLFLATSSSVTPGVPWPNIEAYFQALQHFSTVGRSG